MRERHISRNRKIVKIVLRNPNRILPEFFPVLNKLLVRDLHKNGKFNKMTGHLHTLFANKKRIA